MKLCIFGGGAVGSYLAAQFARAGGCEVSLIGRGPHLEAVAKSGLQLRTGGELLPVPPIRAVRSAAELPRQDIVFVTVKAHSLPAVADELGTLTGESGCAVFANNGIPWWWNHGTGAARGPLQEVDPEGRLWHGFGPDRALGCVLYSANQVAEPGVVEHFGNNRWLIAEPDNSASDRAARVVALMQNAGLGAELSTDLRTDIWKKLLRNAPFNTLCALTRLPAGEFPAVRGLAALAQSMTDEVVRVAAAKGWDLPTPSAMDVIASGGLINNNAPNPLALPSMLHDALAQRPMEVAAILGQIRAFADEEALDVPTLGLVHTLLLGLDASFARRAA